MHFFVRAALILTDNVLRQRVDQTMQTIKNGEMTLKLRRAYTYAPKYALFLHYSKMSLGFGNLRDYFRYVLSYT